MERQQTMAVGSAGYVGKPCKVRLWLRNVTLTCQTYVILCKIPIALFTSFSAATGFMLASPRLGPEVFILISGVFLLACGCGALNQYQERDIDACMARTRHRPLPSKRLMPMHALGIALVFMASGLGLLLVLRLPAVVVLIGFAVVWYNGLYTHLKRVTAFAVMPGSLIGAVSPCLGWIVGGGALFDPRLWALCFFFIIWQMPHFWLLLLNHGKDYERAGLPSLTKIFTGAQLQRITLVWTLALAVSSMLLPLFGYHSRIFQMMLVAATGWLGWQGIKFSKTGTQVVCQRLFRQINAYVLFLMVLLVVEQLIEMYSTV